MADETTVVNGALRRLGQTAITSLTDGSTNANRANDIYAELRDEMLRAHLWNFATKRVKLARLTSTPVFEFSYAYAMPTDWLRTISIHDNDAGVGLLFYRQEQQNSQDVIVTDAEAVYLRYIARVTDVNLWAADFVMVMELALARDLAVIIASSNTLADAFAKATAAKLGEAKSLDALDASPEERPRGSWATSRRGRRSWA